MANLPTGLRSTIRDLIADGLFRGGITRPERALAGALSIVTLHRVLPEEERAAYPLGQIALSVEELKWFVEFATRHFSCDTLSESYRRWTSGEHVGNPLLAITFDDGQLDNFVHARPVLERAGIRATFFVTVNAIDGDSPLWHDRVAFALGALLARDRSAGISWLSELGVPVGGDDLALAAAAVARTKRLGEIEKEVVARRLELAAGTGTRPAWDGMMTWDQLRGLAAAGHEIGSHSLTHPLLPAIDSDAVAREVVASRARIRSEVGGRCDAFCYPNGDLNDTVVEAVRDAGYALAVATTWGPNRPGADPLRLTRCDLQGRTSRDRSGMLSTSRLALRLSPWFARTLR